LVSQQSEQTHAPHLKQQTTIPLTKLSPFEHSQHVLTVWFVVVVFFLDMNGWMTWFFLFFDTVPRLVNREHIPHKKGSTILYQYAVHVYMYKYCTCTLQFQ
jgi:hypothetical protein